MVTTERIVEHKLLELYGNELENGSIKIWLLIQYVNTLVDVQWQ